MKGGQDEEVQVVGLKVSEEYEEECDVVIYVGVSSVENVVQGV